MEELLGRVREMSEVAEEIMSDIAELRDIDKPSRVSQREMVRSILPVASVPFAAN